MKKILAVVMVLAMFAALVACEASKGDLTSINDYVAPNNTQVSDTGIFTFEEAGGNTAVITGYVGKAEAHAVVIPAQVVVASLDDSTSNEDNIRKIVGIADNAFYYCTAMTSVTIPDSVESIGNWAFAGCTGLSQIVLPDSVITIGEGAFHGCDKLTSITLSKKLTKIGNFAFYGCNGLSAIDLPATLTEIGSAAFFGCQGLTKLDIPAATTIIGDMAFYQCNYLTEVKINTNAEVLEFGDYIFWSGLVDPETDFGEADRAPEGYKAIGAFLVPADSAAEKFVSSIVVSNIGGPVTEEETSAPEEQTTEAEEQTTETAE